MTTTSTEHDIQAYAIERNGMASARCDIHRVYTAEQWSTLSGASHGFRCDDGRSLRFVTEMGGHPVFTAMRDLSGLAWLVQGKAEASAHGHDDQEIRIWLWLGGGDLEELKVSLQHRSAFDEADFAYGTWVVTRADGEVIVTVRVPVDGRG